VTAVQELFDGVWINLGVDAARAPTPARLQPGIGLRPGEPGHPAAPYVPILYAALYESVAAHSRLGLNVAVDVGHYESEILAAGAERLEGLPVLFVGVHCPLETIMERRRAAGAERYAIAAEDEPVPAPVQRWQHEVHGEWAYDLEVDTSRLSASECAAAVAERLRGSPPTAFARLAR
jgi:chloramphenicol 3-O phosphotransferase